MSARTIYLIKRLETEVTSRMIQSLSEFEITPSQFIILSFVGDSETDLSSAQLSRRFLMTPQSMNEVVNHLKRKELLEKVRDPAHKRILRLRLTEKGLQVLDACNEAMDLLENDLLAGLSKEELTGFRAFVRKILSGTS